MAQKNEKGFTLIELVIVVIILAVMGTIAVISMNGYSSQSRNGVRVSDIQNIENALELYSTKNGSYPLPSTGDIMDLSGDLQWKQGEVNEDLIKQIGGLEKLPVDPLKNELYGYSKSYGIEEYQLEYKLEQASTYNNSYADNKSVQISGDYNGIFNISKSGAFYAIPSLFIEEENINSTGENNFYLPDSNNISFEITQISTEKPSTESEYISFTNNLSTAYNKDSIKNISTYSTVINYPTDDNKKLYLAETLLGKKSNVTYEELLGESATSIYTCYGGELPDNTVKLNNNNLTDNFTWQKDYPTEPCYYTCQEYYYWDNGECVNWCKIGGPVPPDKCTIKP